MHAKAFLSPKGTSLLFLLFCISTIMGGSGMAQQTSSASRTYEDVATSVLLQRAKEISRALTKAGFIPEETFSNATVDLEGQSEHPSARVLAGCCEYSFRKGAISEIRRRDLFEDRGANSLILRHLTNEILTLTPAASTNRALEFLRLLGYDADRLSPAYKISAADDLMDAGPIRDAGPDFPKDLHFFGELISRKYIKIKVSLNLAEPKAPGELGWQPGTEVEILATTGELLKAFFLPEPVTLAGLKIRGPDVISITGAVDLTTPIFTSAAKILPGTGEVLVGGAAASLVRQAWRDLQEKLGTKKPNCILVCDNLNEPEIVAAQMKKLAGKTPWAGVSHFFRFDLPFDHARMERMAQGKRGLGLLAISGDVETQVEALSALVPRPIPNRQNLEEQESEQIWKRFQKEERERLAPALDEFLGRLRFPDNLADHVLFLWPANTSYLWSLAEGEIDTHLRGKAQIVSFGPVGNGVTYFNGEVLTNGLVVLRLSGFLPLQEDINRRMELAWAGKTNSPAFDPQRLRKLQASRPKRIVSAEAIKPVSELVDKFGAHPLEFLVEIVGDDRIRMLEQADKMEVFQIYPGRAASVHVAGSSTVEGFEEVAQGKTLGQDSAQKLFRALPSDRNVFLNVSACLFSPVVVFRAWNGKESASLIVCFQCGESELKFYNAAGKLTYNLGPFKFDNREMLLELAKQALPDSTVINSIDKKD